MLSSNTVKASGDLGFLSLFLERILRYWAKMNLLSKFYCGSAFSLAGSFLLAAAASFFFSDQHPLRFWAAVALSAASLMLILTWLFTRRLIQTLQSLNAAADQLSIGNFDVDLDQGPVVHCWEILHCSRRECPAFDNRSEKCWYIDHTLCTGTRQARFPDKISDCRKCQVYDNYRGDELTNLTDSFNNAVHRLRHSSKEQRRIHQQMLQRERLSTIGETVAGIAHSIKNILGMIKGGEYLIESGLAKNQSDRIREGWRMVKNGNRFISELVLRMLTLCREHEPQYEEIELSEIVDSVLAVMQSKAQIKNVCIKTALDPSLPRVIVDASCLREALINLADNAVDACFENRGIIVIGSLQNKDGFFDVYVEDNGSGISPENCAQVLSPFFTTKGDKGAGLGLAVAQKIVSEHGGEIVIHSQPNKGSRIVLRLPLLDRVPIQSAPPVFLERMSPVAQNSLSVAPFTSKSVNP